MKTINNTTTNPTTDTTTFSLEQLRKVRPRTVPIEDIDPAILASWVSDIANAELEALELLQARYEQLSDLLLSHEDNHTPVSNYERQAIDAEMVAIMDTLSPKAKR